jgi:hypothetical protein
LGTDQWIRAALAALAVTLAGGCIGAVDRDDFDRVIQERGGGFTSDLPLDAVEAVAGELDVEDFDVRSMSFTASTETVVLEVRDPAAPENLDQYVVRQGDVDTVEPLRLSASDDLDQQTFPVSSVALDRIESMVDVALDGFDARGGYVSSASVGLIGDGDVTFQLSLESPRATAVARFTGGGELVEVTRS